MGYSIKVLSSDEFDKLPYSHASMALGLADVKHNKVYVRHFAYPELNKYLLDHEVDHLVEKVPTDEIDGVRYKIPLGSIASGIGRVASRALPAIGGAVRSAGTGIGGALSKVASKAVPALSSGFTGLGSSLAKGISVPAGVPNFLSPTQLAQQNFLNSGLSGVLGTAAKFAPQAADFFKGVFGQSSQNAQSPVDPFSSVIDQFQASQAQQPAQTQSAYPQTATTQSSQPASSLSSFGINPQNLLGAGALGVGLTSKPPTVPPLPSSVEELRSTVKGGGSQIGQLGKQKLTDLLNQQFEPMNEPEIQAALRQLDQQRLVEEDQIRDAYRNLRPGLSEFEDSSFQKDLNDLRERFGRARSDVLATRTRDLKQNFDTNRRIQIQQAFGASDSEMQQLMQLAQMDVNQIMAQLGLDAQGAMLFKQTFLNLGSSLISPPSVMDQFLQRQLAERG